MNEITYLPLEAEDAATLCGWSDNHAATIFYNDGKTIRVRMDHAEILNGHNSDAPDKLSFSPGGFFGHTSGVQRWRHWPDPDGSTYTFTLRKNGKWVQQGLKMGQGYRLIIGKRLHHYDYNF